MQIIFNKRGLIWANGATIIKNGFQMRIVNDAENTLSHVKKLMLMTKKLKAFKLTEKNIATIRQHMEFLRVDNESMALRDILDTCHIFMDRRNRDIARLWFDLGTLGVNLDNVNYVIPLALKGNPAEILREKPRDSRTKNKKLS